MKNVKKIAILGVGFMGGSLAKAIGDKYPEVSIWGFARSREAYLRLKKAKVLNVVDMNLVNVVRDADMVVLALPVGIIIEYLQLISPYLKKDAIIFDLGSTKEKIDIAARKLLPRSVNFIGCHPLAGSEKKGVEFSRADLYQGALCLIVSSASKKGVKQVKSLWQKLGSKVVFVSPAYHDKVLSLLSHLPHLISFSLSETVCGEYLKLAPRSFKDLTRISSSPASVWADIFLTNKKNLIKDMKQFIKILKQYEFFLKKNDRTKIIDLINKANSKQKKL